MKYGLLLLLFLAACSQKNQGPNKFSDAKIINIYELQDRRDTKTLLPFLKAKKETHRIAAAMAFASIQDTIAIPYLNQMLQIDQDPMPRRAAAYALGQIASTKALGILTAAFDQELFPANRPYVMEAIGKCGDSSTVVLFEGVEYTDSALQMGWAYGVFRLGLKGFRSQPLNNRMMHFLNNDNKDLAILASHYVYRNLREMGDDGSERVDSLLAVARYDEVKERFMLLKEENNHPSLSESQFFYEIGMKSDYEIAAMIEHFPSMTNQFEKYAFQIVNDSNASSVIRNATLEKVLSLCQNNMTRKWNYVLMGLKSNDMALQSIAALEIQKIGKPKYVLETKAMLDAMYEECIQVKSQLKLPQQAETYKDICKAIEALGGDKFIGYQPAYNHPIDWEFIKTIPKDQQVLLTTNKGDITLQLFVEDAPGTVANFLQLTDSGVYDGKFFHRVVPKFVIQGGCPRGDGWGSLDWSQRSEFSNYQRYETGTVGIASAGKDTEGVQFFISHCPTPHLDGRYTIFARVINGMDVVNRIDVGDEIVRVKRL